MNKYFTDKERLKGVVHVPVIVEYNDDMTFEEVEEYVISLYSHYSFGGSHVNAYLDKEGRGE